MSTARVDFTRSAAERIAAVVRKVEQGDRDGSALTYGIADQPIKVFRMCTFTGAWSLNSAKTVTLRNSTATLVAFNVFAPLAGACGESPVAVAKDGTAWYAIAARCS
jgi:hypothetical protein